MMSMLRRKVQGRQPGGPVQRGVLDASRPADAAEADHHDRRVLGALWHGRLHGENQQQQGDHVKGLHKAADPVPGRIRHGL